MNHVRYPQSGIQVVTSSGGLPTLGVMTRELPDEVLDLLDYQAGVLTRVQA